MSGSSTVRKTVVAGVLGAVSIVLIVTPLGMIPWVTGTSLTTMHVPAIVAAVVEGPVVGVVTGAIFGIAALVRAAVAPNGPGDLLFVNPLISVLPRLLFPLVAWVVYRAFRGKLTAIAAACAGIAGSIAHTAFVLTALMAARALPPASALGLLVANGPLEAAVAAVLTVAVVSAWKGVGSRSGRAKLADEEKK